MKTKRFNIKRVKVPAAVTLQATAALVLGIYFEKVRFDELAHVKGVGIDSKGIHLVFVNQEGANGITRFDKHGKGLART